MYWLLSPENKLRVEVVDDGNSKLNSTLVIETEDEVRLNPSH